MRKTGLEIEGYIYSLAVRSLPIRGKVYRNGTRPYNSQGEDAVVSFLSGIDGWDSFSQVGIVNLNVHVRNIVSSTYSMKDVDRCEEIEQALLSLVEEHRTGDYWLQTDGAAQVTPDGDNWHVVSIRIKYRYNRIN